tara:strand:- start:40696 stop:41874 length:1179 start_codon:yes stop_codon:yes gene_type:complete
MLYHFIVLACGTVGIAVSFTVARFIRSNRIFNFYLLIILLYISLAYLAFATRNLGIQSFTEGYITPIKTFSVFMFPLMYLYFESLLKNDTRFKKWHLLHFIFPLLYFVSLISLIEIGAFSPSLQSLFYAGYALFCFATLLATLWMLRRNLFDTAIRENYGQKEWTLMRNWIMTLLATYVMVVLRMVVVIFFELRTGTFSGLDNYIWISSLIWLFVFLKILNSPEILYGYGSMEKKVKAYMGTNIPVTDHWALKDAHGISNPQDRKLAQKMVENNARYIEQLEKMTLGSDHFLDPKFDLQELAALMNVPKSHVVHLFKYHCNLSFSEYKKRTQIQHAVKLINEGYLGSNTLNALANQVGFSSYNPFFLAFKKYTGKTPNMYVSNSLNDKVVDR